MGQNGNEISAVHIRLISCCLMDTDAHMFRYTGQTLTLIYIHVHTSTGKYPEISQTMDPA